MIYRRLESAIRQSLGDFPVVGLVGARQVGKTTIAKRVAAGLPGSAIYLDVERPSDQAKLHEPELFLEAHASRLVILDEIQRQPDLFPLLRSLVDADRRAGRFLILGSVSLNLVRQASESLAGRIIYHELAPFALDEVEPSPENLRALWIRGGFPLSFLAPTYRDSASWREAFIQTHLERDIPALGIRVSTAALRRFWQMLAHLHGQQWNGSKIATGLGVSVPTVRSYLDILEDTYMVRRLQPYHANAKKRLVKAPKVYLRDSGLLHALLRIESLEDLSGHPVVGASWEGWVIEQVLAGIPRGWPAWYYRTAAGAEIDLVIERPPPAGPLAIEIKYSTDPRPSRGFWSALADLDHARGFVICPAEERIPLGGGVLALPAVAIGHLDWRSL